MAGTAWEVSSDVFRGCQAATYCWEVLPRASCLCCSLSWSQVSFSDDSDLEDLVLAEPVEEVRRRGARGRGQTRKGPGSKTDTAVGAGSGPGRSSVSGIGGRSRRARKEAPGLCEEETAKTSICVRASAGPEVMRTIPEENLTDSRLEMSFEMLRASDGEDATGGRTSRG